MDLSDVSALRPTIGQLRARENLRRSEYADAMLMRSGAIMNAYRDIAERPELWRTPRSRREAHIGPIDTKQPSAEFLAILKAELERDQKPPCGWAGLIFWACVVAFSGWAFVSLVFSFPWGK